MPYGENQILERVGKIRDDIRDCIAKTGEDIKRNNNLVNVQYLSATGSVVESINLSTIRTNAMFARNIIDDVVKIVDLEEKRRKYLVELDGCRKRNDVKKNRKRKREMVNEDNPYNPKLRRQTSLQ